VFSKFHKKENISPVIPLRRTCRCRWVQEASSKHTASHPVNGAVSSPFAVSRPTVS
jgi:hypothetical protein